MTEYEAERGMPADAETVFATACDVGRMGRWLPAPVERIAPGRMHMHGSVAGQSVDEDGRYAAEPGQLRLEWGREGYAGWLQVAHAETGSAVTLHLSFLGDVPQADAGRAETDALRREMDDSLDRLWQEVEEVSVRLGTRQRPPDR